MRKRTEHIINQDYTIFRAHTTATATARTEQCDTHTHAFRGNRGGGSPNGPFPRQPTQEVGLPIINHFPRAKWCPPETQDAPPTKRPFLLVAVCFFFALVGSSGSHFVHNYNLCAFLVRHTLGAASGRSARPVEH